MVFFLTSPLEQFLLLPDDVTKICTIIFGIPIGEDPHTMFNFYHLKDIYNFFLLDIFLIDYLNNNFILTLVNIQYYKLSLFLIGLITFISTYRSDIFPNSIWHIFLNKFMS